MLKTAAVLCAATLALTACGNGDDDKAKENIQTSIMEQGDSITGGTKPTEKQAQCIADGMVDDVGVDKLKEYELLNDDLEIVEDADPKDMNKEDADALAAVFVDCVDMKKLFEESFSSGAGADQLTDEQRQCLSDAIDEDAIQDALSSSFQGKDEDMTSKMTEDLMKCVTTGTGGDSEMQMP